VLFRLLEESPGAKAHRFFRGNFRGLKPPAPSAGTSKSRAGHQFIERLPAKGLLRIAD
jgi:hypothetical protein